MSDAVGNDYASIGRRSVPRVVTDIPASGDYWTGPTQFVVKEEAQGVFRWVMISGDGRGLQLAQSASVFPSANACSDEVKRLDPNATVALEKQGQSLLPS